MHNHRRISKVVSAFYDSYFEPQQEKNRDYEIDATVSEYKSRFVKEWQKILNEALDAREYELLTYGMTTAEIRQDLALQRRLGVEQAKKLMKADISSYQDVKEILDDPEYTDIWDVFDGFWEYLDRDIEHGIQNEIQ